MTPEHPGVPRRFESGGHELAPREVPGSAGVRALFWSPDSAFIGFQARGRLWKVGVAGGEPIAMAQTPLDFSQAGGAAWLADDRIVFTTGGTGLLEVPAQGGTSRTILELDPAVEADFHDASPLPDGQAVLFVVHRTKGEHAIDAFDGRRRTRVYTSPDGLIFDPVYASSGHLLFFRDSGTWALPFSPSTFEPSGEPFMIAPGGGQPSASTDGMLAVVPTGAPSETQLTWVDRTGQLQGTLGRGGLRVLYPRLSPDGRFVAATVFEGHNDIWIFDVQRGTERRLTFEPDADSLPVWSPDGAFIVYQCGTAICSRRADGSGQRRTIVESPASGPAVSPDGRSLVFQRFQPATNIDLWVVELTPAGLDAPPTAPPRAFVADRFQQVGATISPDGRYAAYHSNETGLYEVFVTRFPSGDGKWQVSHDTSGYSPRWSAKGDRLFFASPNPLREVDVETTPALTIGSSRPLVPLRELGLQSAALSSFDRSADGSRFIAAQSSARTIDESHIIIVQNWLAEHRAKGR